MDVEAIVHSGELYLPMDETILHQQLGYLDELFAFNQRTNFGGRHVHFGKGVYANFNLTLVDDTHIYVGDHTMFGPNVTVATAGHPIDPALRRKGYQYNAPVRIGENCWLGAGVIVLPGVTIGDNVVIGAGSVVTKDIPSNVVAVGNPCRVLRPVGERDREYYFKDRRIPESVRQG